MSLPPSFTAFVERFGEAIASVVLTLVYFLVLGPLALVARLFRDPLGLRRGPDDSAWQPWTGDGAGSLDTTPSSAPFDRVEALRRARRQS
ncbi:hypothetical protein Pla163_20130 [Planctomycetes bacterium Pla163]|uniref:Uncharacterized protein n=1 Tax=Rohdeia mirabilis TaxID=2528008 RepID=A0A518D0B3_9BACT|nr:hypothetical protein Pla163_20130 [Planctomycetes bacterium Pla163]